jgi:hypothetical protein
MTSDTLAQKTYVPLLLWTLVARVAKMDMQQRVNCRIECFVAHTQSTHTIVWRIVHCMAKYLPRMKFSDVGLETVFWRSWSRTCRSWSRSRSQPYRSRNFNPKSNSKFTTQRATIPTKVERLNAMNSHLYRLYGAACTQLH